MKSQSPEEDACGSPEGVCGSGSLSKCSGAVMMRTSIITGVLSPTHQTTGQNLSFPSYRHTHCHWMAMRGNPVVNNTVDLKIGNSQKTANSNIPPKDKTVKIAGKLPTFQGI